MIGEVIQCEKLGCDVIFAKKTHNQIYHDAECTRLATNANIKAQYHQRRAQKLGHARFCDKCESKLSKYNSSNRCNLCTQKSETERNNAVTDMLASISWVS